MSPRQPSETALDGTPARAKRSRTASSRRRPGPSASQCRRFHHWAPAFAGATACCIPRSGFRPLSRGFTLIEVLVALAVIALAMTALLASGARMARDQQRFEQVSLAAFAADTVLTETRLKEPFPAIGRRQGLTAIGHYRFRWEMVVQATPEAAIRRLDLHLYPDPRPADAAAIVSLSGFAGQP